MPSINWDTVSTAGATALVVTLAVEYVAKPRLEARKEAILDALRARREVQALVLRMTVAAQRYAADMPDGVDPRLRTKWATERNRQYAVLEELVLKLSDEVPRYASTFRQPLRDLVVQVAYTAFGIMLSLRPKTRKAQMLVELGTAAAAVLDLPAPWKVVWRALPWQRSADEVRRLVAQAEGEPAPDAGGKQVG
ncbi:hypothetical protein [Actinoplanes sp. NPDC049599]|uniref:hypothetical protein n=1 Tax=Actinoplanes sp. NPDC049599 TaxID=3363903 RepID=UPI0037B2FBDC